MSSAGLAAMYSKAYDDQVTETVARLRRAVDEFERDARRVQHQHHPARPGADARAGGVGPYACGPHSTACGDAIGGLMAMLMNLHLQGLIRAAAVADDNRGVT